MEEKKLKPGTSEYWMDWYWNRGGREQTLQRRIEKTESVM